MKKYAILTYTSKGMVFGSAPEDETAAQLDEGTALSGRRRADGTAENLIRDESGKIIRFVSPVAALNYCEEIGWNLEQTIFEPNEGFNSRDPLSVYIFVLSRDV
jgi:hypothetical protein